MDTITQNIQEFSKILKTSKKILLINHIRIDGDAYGSLGAFYYTLKKLGYQVKATNDDKSPENFQFLCEERFIDETINIPEYNPDLIISFDAASLGQLGKKYSENVEFFNKTKFVVIDHHFTNNSFGDINIVTADISSACELTYRVIKELGYESHIDSKIATLLLAGIYTDTNNFFNANTTSETLYTAARLMELGADSRTPMYEFFKKKQYKKSKLWGEILKDLKEENNGKIVYAIVTQELFKKTGTSTGDLSGLINEFLSNIEGMDVCFLAYQTDEGGTKVSMRSQVFNVATFSEHFSGGGHIQAAGFITDKHIDIVKEEVLEKLKKELI